MNSNFKKIINDLALSLKKVDSRKPVYQSARGQKKIYQPGIGPHPETKTIELVVTEMKESNLDFYKHTTMEKPYPKGERNQWDFNKNLISAETGRKKCDLEFVLKDETIYSEVKMMRIMGDNGKPNDNIFTHIFSPYPVQNSALTDGIKLLNSNFEGLKSIIIYGYDYEKLPLINTIELFELIGKEFFSLSERYSSSFQDLVHPIHQRGQVFSWIITK